MTYPRTVPAIVTGILFLAAAVALPLQPAFGEGGARRDVARHAAETAAEPTCPLKLSVTTPRIPGLEPQESWLKRAQRRKQARIRRYIVCRTPGDAGLDNSYCSTIVRKYHSIDVSHTAPGEDSAHSRKRAA